MSNQNTLEPSGKNQENALSLDARLDILQRKTKADGFQLRDDVIEYIANVTTGGRHSVEASLLRVIAYSSLTQSDPTVDSATVALQTRSISLTRQVTPPSGIAKKKKRKAKARTQGSPIVGIIQGCCLGTGGFCAMIGTCLCIDYAAHQMNIMTLSVSWLWWTILVMNALTATIPIDIYRFRQHRSEKSRQFRISQRSLLAFASTGIALFFVVLFGYQETVIHLFTNAGFLH